VSIRSSWIQGALQINPIGNSFSVWPIEIYFLMFYCKGHITNKPFTLEGQAWHYPSLQKAIMGFKSKAWMSWWGKRKRRRKHSFCSSRLFILMLLLQRTFLHYNSVRTMSSFVSCHAQNDMYPIHPCDVKNEPLFNLSWLKGASDLASLGPSDL
jgi:hypothetical protein